MPVRVCEHAVSSEAFTLYFKPTVRHAHYNFYGRVQVSSNKTSGRAWRLFSGMGTTSAPVDARFNDRFWGQLFYNQYDYPGNIAGRVSWVLNTTRPNLYIRMGDTTTVTLNRLPASGRVVDIHERFTENWRRTIPLRLSGVKNRQAIYV